MVLLYEKSSCVALAATALFIGTLYIKTSLIEARDVRMRRDTTEPGPIELLFNDIGGRQKVDLVVAIDRSKSMNKQVYYLKAKKMAAAILKQYATLHLDYVRLAVITFALDSTIALDGISNPDIADTKCSLFSGGDDSQWNNIMYTDDPDKLAGTNIKAAFRQAINVFQKGKEFRPEAKRVVLILTDGKYNDENDPIGESNELREFLDATIYGVGVGTWLEIGNVRVITSPYQGSYLYGGYNDWYKLVREEGPITSFSTNTSQEWRGIFSGFCTDVCTDNSACFCDIDRGYEQCVCSSGNYYNSSSGLCNECEAGTYKENAGNFDGCVPCPTGSVSPPGSTSKYSCVCQSPPCEDPCDANPCNPRENCIPTNTTEFVCECKDGWEGDGCDVNQDECVVSSSLCQHQSTCQDGLGTDLFGCVCTEWGYSGRYCEVNDNECTPDMCLNNGTCKDQINNFECDCINGWYGRHCQDDPILTQSTSTTTTTTTTTTTPVPTTTTTTSTTPSTITPKPSVLEGSLLWIVVGCAVGGGLLVIVIIIVICMCLCRKKKEKNKEEVKGIAQQFSGFWKRKTVRGSKWMDEEVNGGLPSAPTRHRPDLLSDTANMYSSVENLKTDEYAELPYQTLTLKTGMESWQTYITELEESKVICRGLITKANGDKKAKTSSWMFDQSEMARLDMMMADEEVNIPVIVQDGEYHIRENDGTIATGSTIGSMQEAKIIVIGKTKTYLIVVTALDEKDDGKARKEVEWIVDHIAGEGY